VHHSHKVKESVCSQKLPLDRRKFPILITCLASLTQVYNVWPIGTIKTAEHWSPIPQNTFHEPSYSEFIEWILTLNKIFHHRNISETYFDSKGHKIKIIGNRIGVIPW